MDLAKWKAAHSGGRLRQAVLSDLYVQMRLLKPVRGFISCIDFLLCMAYGSPKLLQGLIPC